MTVYERYLKFRSSIEPWLAGRRPVEVDPEAQGCLLRTHGVGFRRRRVGKWTKKMERERLTANRNRS